MKRGARWCGGLVVIALLGIVTAARAAMRVTHLECEYAVDPLGIDVARPRLFWQVEDDTRGAEQTAWRVLVASSRERLAAGEGDLWDSRKVGDGRTTQVVYDGKPIASAQEVFWKVQVWDGAGTVSEWSDVATWTMGLPRPGDWQARWIAAPGDRLENTLLRRTFAVGPGLRRALVAVSGLGQYELFCNGEKASTDVLAPGWTDYADTILYDTRDVTAFLREGRNALGLSLGNGMYHVVRPDGRFAKFVHSFGAQRAILQLRLEYDDGHVETVGTDTEWKTHAGPITFSSIYGGEDFDARRVQPRWDEADFDDGTWSNAVLVEDGLEKLHGFTHAAQRIEPIETERPVSVRTLGAGAELVDFGRNAAFMPRIRVSGPAGSVVRLTGGELINDDGTIDRDSMGGAHRGSAWWSYTKATDEVETWQPQFYYIGARYLHVELTPAKEGGARPTLDRVERVVIRAAAEAAGHFACSDPTLNRIEEIIRRAQEANMMSVITDCPHREKLGWLEQAHLDGPALRYEWQLARLAAKNVNDMADAQTPEGLIPNIAPEYTVFKGTYRAAAEWGASFIQVPWQQYLFCGDTTVLREHYAAMKAYLAYLEKRANDGLLDEGLGDWNDVIAGKGKRAGLTPPAVTATAFYFQDARTLAGIAAVLGHEEEALAFAAKAESIAETYRRELGPSAAHEGWGSGSLTSMALPLALGIVPESERPAVFAAMVKEIETRGYSTAGAVGNRYVLQALTGGGRSDLIRQLATNRDAPGYGWQLANGATTMTETWNASKGASQDHFFLGQIVEWLFGDLAGLRPDENEPGFKRMIVRPRPVAGVSWAEASHDSPHGRHAVRWERRDGNLWLTVEVPANTRATVWVPTKDAPAVTESGRTATEAEGVRLVRVEDGCAVYDVGAGNYRFESKW